MKKSLVNNKYLLEKFDGKGGWTYARIPEILQDKKNPFGWVKVKGTIDGFEIKKYNLMPMGNNQLFLPVKAEIRKKIQKQVGDYVQVILYLDNEPLEVPPEMLLCLLDEPKANDFFNSLSENEQLKYIKWIHNEKTEAIKVQRLAETIKNLHQEKKYYFKK